MYQILVISSFMYQTRCETQIPRVKSCPSFKISLSGDPNSLLCCEIFCSCRNRSSILPVPRDSFETVLSWLYLVINRVHGCRHYFTLNVSPYLHTEYFSTTFLFHRHILLPFSTFRIWINYVCYRRFAERNNKDLAYFRGGWAWKCQEHEKPYFTQKCSS